MNMWKYKTDAKGQPTTAVKYGLERCRTPDFSTHEGRLKFSYAYLEFVREDSK